jgi:hypothetical protein
MPDNAIYYHAAYLTAALLYGGYVVSLAWRAKSVGKREMGNGKRGSGP